jgi:hypothetical protein
MIATGTDPSLPLGMTLKVEGLGMTLKVEGLGMTLKVAPRLADFQMRSPTLEE